MSHAPLASVSESDAARATDVEALEGDAGSEALLTALNDPRCRSIIDATVDQPRSATELSEYCDIPLSTTYRKLEILTEAGLLAERTRISPGGSHPSEYTLVADDIVLSVGGENGLELHVSPDPDEDTASIPTLAEH